MIVTPLTFLGGSFYSIHMLPPLWQTITLFNPVVYLISGFRWSFYGVADVNVGISLFGFIIGVWSDGFEKLQVIPLMIVTPLTFLGGSFYSINMLPPIWQKITLFNPIVYLVSGFRWSFYEHSDVSVTISITMILTFTVICLAIIGWIFKTGYGLKK